MIVDVTEERISSIYPDLLRQVIEEGNEVESRAGTTREIPFLLLVTDQPQWCVVGRDKFSKKFMDLEIAMLLAGVFDEVLVEGVSKQASELTSLATAYGPRTKEQLKTCENELKENPESRRAVVYIGRENDLLRVRIDVPELKGEMPCTMTWQFLRRNGKLMMAVTMRSWDLVWGLSYDVPCFVAIQMAMAEALGDKLGSYYHFAGSAHVYERHWDLEAWDPEGAGELVIPWLGKSIHETQLKADLELGKMLQRLVSP